MTDAGVRTIHVDLGPRSYPVVVGPGQIDRLGALIRDRLGPVRACALVADVGVGEDTIARARASLAALTRSAPPVLRLTPSEPSKSLGTLGEVLAFLSAARLARGEPVVALGGGIVGDLAGFAAATYRRGVPVVQCPTTLLAMVDASVGGKTGVNLEVGGALKKNMVGAFHQPALVVADPAVLTSLPERTFRAGLAECIKHGLIAGGLGLVTLVDEMAGLVRASLGRDPAALTALVSRNVELKALVVAGDEREEAPSAAGGRALLNLGHTFGHAIETLPGLTLSGGSAGGVEHGEAVGLGIVAAATCSKAMGLLSDGDARAIVARVEAAGLPTRVGGLPDAEAVMELMRDDKKVSGSVLRLVLPVGVGWCRVVEGPEPGAVRAGIDALRA